MAAGSTRYWAWRERSVDDYISVVLGNLGYFQRVLDLVGFPFEGERIPSLTVRNRAFDEGLEESRLYHTHELSPFVMPIFLVYSISRTDSKAGRE